MAITTPNWNVNLGLAPQAPAVANPTGGAGPAAWWNPLSGGPGAQPSQPSLATPPFAPPAGAGGELSQLAGQVKPYAPGAVAGWMGRDALVRNVGRRGPRSTYGTGYRAPSSRARSQNRGPSVRINGEGAFANFMSAAKTSALVAAALSVVQHGGAYMRGQTTFAVAAAEITNDTAAGALGGFAGAAASTAACTMLAGVVGTGFGLTLVGLVAGVAAYSVVDAWFRSTQVSLKLRSTIHNVLA